VARAIFEHYLPTGQDSPLPESTAGSLLAIADKMDNLTGCFGLNMIPTGAHDPYALRRQALGIVRILLEKGLRISLSDLLGEAREAYDEVEWKLGPDKSREALLEFFAQRLRASFTGQGFETRIVEAAVQAGIDDVYLLSKRLEALDRFSREPDFEQSVLTFKRADNIIRKQGDSVSVPLDGRFDASLLQEDQEQELAKHLERMKPRWEELWQEEAFDELLGLLRELRPVVDGFFDRVMVMAEDQSLRANRLNLLQSLVTRLSQLAAFNALQI
jgi:glycyl-tRNA synthetase beta chain